MLVQHQLEPKCYVTNPKSKILVVHQVLRIIIIRKDRLRIFMIIYAAFFCEIAFWQRFLLLKKFRRRRESNPWCRVQLFRNIWNQLGRKWGTSGTLGPIRISPKVEKFNFVGGQGGGVFRVRRHLVVEIINLYPLCPARANCGRNF